MFVGIEIQYELEPAVILEFKHIPSHNCPWDVCSQLPSFWQKVTHPQDYEYDQFDCDTTWNLIEQKMTPYHS